MTLDLTPRTIAGDGAALYLDAAAFPRALDQAAAARDWVAKVALSGRAVLTDETLDALRLCVSELVTNAVRYGNAGPELGVIVIQRYRHAIRIEVIDQGNTGGHVPEIMAAGVDQDGGRGLFMVDAFATSWGAVREADGGHVLWCEVQNDPPRIPDPA